MAKVTIETCELTFAKIVAEHDQIEEANTVQAIVALVDAYDAAHRYKDYSVRQHLIDALIRRDG